MPWSIADDRLQLDEDEGRAGVAHELKVAAVVLAGDPVLDAGLDWTG